MPVYFIIYLLFQWKPVPILAASNIKTIKEGGATILIPTLKGVDQQEAQSVFYNPVQEFNRDLSVLVLREYSQLKLKPITILEPLAASGLRTIRFMKEVPLIEHAFANDLEQEAVNMMKENLKLNDLTTKVEGCRIISFQRRR
jgi:tRNA (guanine26-N2/guanine27-N2)-dimethyltransferase